MSRYFPQLNISSKDIKVQVGLTSYAIKSGVKKRLMHQHHPL